jgi:transcriptional regulator of acetoin/glycerol metabolism
VDPARKIVLPADLPACMRRADTNGLDSERDRLIAALSATFWNKTKAAKQLQCSRMTLYRKMIKYDLSLSPPAPALQTNRHQ